MAFSSMPARCGLPAFGIVRRARGGLVQWYQRPRYAAAAAAAAAERSAGASGGFRRPFVLGIETSCDDTCAAVVDASGAVLGEARRSQHHIHSAHGGVVPNLAMEAHQGAIDEVVAQALGEARRAVGMAPAAADGAVADAAAGVVDAVAATIGPGLVLCLRVGVAKARQVAARLGLPFVPVHHMEAHTLVARADAGVRDTLRFPFVALLVSGGHNMLVLARGLGEYTILGSTLDDAAGEAFDKTARLLGLDVRNGGGVAIEQLARRGDPHALGFPVPLKRNRVRAKTCDFSFAGLKTSVRLYIERIGAGGGGAAGAAAAGEELDPEELLRRKADVAASFQHTVVTHLRDRTARAVEWARAMEPDISCLVVSGGVASNDSVRSALREVAEAAGLPLVCPPRSLCTDNGVMVAWAGHERLAAGLGEAAPSMEEVHAAARDPKSVRFHLRPRWPIGEADERSAHGLRSQKSADIADALTGIR